MLVRLTFILTISLFLYSAMPGQAFANNIALVNASLEDKDTAANTYDVEFDVSWDHSWRIAGAPAIGANWDAAWVFAKFSKRTGSGWSDWAHCTLLNTGSVAPGGSVITFGSTGAAYKGAFIYRSGEGASGTVSWANAQLRWAYGTDGIADTDTVKVKVFAVEMVYLPAGILFVGDTNNTLANTFYEGATTHEFQITSEGAITVGDAAGQLYYDLDNVNGGDRTGPIPAAFPKGYQAFYVMKYEVSQREYAEFLNTLTPAQQANRWVSGNFNTNRYFIKKGLDGRFATDADNDAGADGSADWALMNEAVDGGWVACNFLSWMDLAAYADWAALRPMTEFEYEKAARGPQPSVDDEYAWGNTTLEAATTALSNAGQTTEVPDQGNMNYAAASPDGPFRVGSFADSGATRVNAGAGYYNVLELSGNLWERVVTVGDATGRAFDGAPGDGILSANGHATTANWPGLSSGEVTGRVGSGFRGGAWDDVTAYVCISDRVIAAGDLGDRVKGLGGRLARTSP